MPNRNRLESGKFKWPKSMLSVTSISRQQYDWLMNGLDIYQRDGFFEVWHAKSYRIRPRNTDFRLFLCFLLLLLPYTIR